LPAKALLKVGGYPSAILAALRAANRGHTTLLATSNDLSDDILAEQARSHGLAVFRGPLKDVLARYYLASINLPEDGAVIRLTADNVLPDGDFVDELAHAFASSDTDYLSTDSLECGLPYGLGGEVFSVAALRNAHHQATLPEDREHVGPWIRRNCSSVVYCPRRSDDSDYSYLRCTIDDQEDYGRIVRLFDQAADPVEMGWQNLLQKLSRLPGEARFGIPFRMGAGRAHSLMTLGTAQLGMDYGVVNDCGQPSTEQAIAIVHQAIAHGVTSLDTASSYGAAEEVLGRALRGSWGSRAHIITKLDLSGLGETAGENEVRAAVDGGVRKSCERLGLERLAVLLVHRWCDHHAWNGAAWRRLLELREEGKIGTLGASVYGPEEAIEALQDRTIGHLQVPYNVLDWRWEAGGVNRAVLRRPDVVVHARSALLQGILASPAVRWPAVELFDAAECVRALHRFARELGRESVTDLCLAYVRSAPWVTSAVVGCETMKQLDENLRLFATRSLSLSQCEQLRQGLPHPPEMLLNPSKWKTAHEHSAVR